MNERRSTDGARRCRGRPPHEPVRELDRITGRRLLLGRALRNELAYPPLKLLFPIALGDELRRFFQRPPFVGGVVGSLARIENGLQDVPLCDVRVEVIRPHRADARRRPGLQFAFRLEDWRPLDLPRAWRDLEISPLVIGGTLEKLALFGSEPRHLRGVSHDLRDAAVDLFEGRRPRIAAERDGRPRELGLLRELPPHIPPARLFEGLVGVERPFPELLPLGHRDVRRSRGFRPRQRRRRRSWGWGWRWRRRRRGRRSRGFAAGEKRLKLVLFFLLRRRRRPLRGAFLQKAFEFFSFVLNISPSRCTRISRPVCESPRRQ